MSEFKAKVSEILKDIDGGEEVIITRRGKLCGRLTAVPQPARTKPSLSTLKGSIHRLPDADYQDFLDIKTLWEHLPTHNCPRNRAAPELL